MEGKIMESNWTPTARELPPEGELVYAMDRGGAVMKLYLKAGLWWVESGEMYVYLTPVFWHRISA